MICHRPEKTLSQAEVSTPHVRSVCLRPRLRTKLGLRDCEHVGHHTVRPPPLNSCSSTTNSAGQQYDKRLLRVSVALRFLQMPSWWLNRTVARQHVCGRRSIHHALLLFLQTYDSPTRTREHEYVTQDGLSIACFFGPRLMPIFMADEPCPSIPTCPHTCPKSY